MRYRHRPSEVEAWHWDYDTDFDRAAPPWLKEQVEAGTLLVGQRTLRFTTWQGFVHVDRGVWLVLGEDGVYPCKPDIFDLMYEEVLPGDCRPN